MEPLVVYRVEVWTTVSPRYMNVAVPWDGIYHCILSQTNDGTPNYCTLGARIKVWRVLTMPLMRSVVLCSPPTHGTFVN